MDHPIIKLFEAKAEILELSGNKEGIDAAIVQLAGWIDSAQGRLTEDDLAVLSDIGAMLYRDGLGRR